MIAKGLNLLMCTRRRGGSAESCGLQRPSFIALSYDLYITYEQGEIQHFMSLIYFSDQISKSDPSEVL